MSSINPGLSISGHACLYCQYKENCCYKNIKDCMPYEEAAERIKNTLMLFTMYLRRKKYEV